MVGIGEMEEWWEGTEATMSPDFLSVRFRVETSPSKRNSRNSRGEMVNV